MTANALLGSRIPVKCTAYGTPATGATARGSWPNLKEQVQHDQRYARALRCAIPGEGGLMPSNEARAVAQGARWWLIDYLTEAGTPVAVDDVFAAAAEAGFTKHQITYARKAAGMTSERVGSAPASYLVWALNPAIPPGARPRAYALACARPTEKYPEGRTGTAAGVPAHQRAQEPVCPACEAAGKAYSGVHYRTRTAGQRRAEYERNHDYYVERNYQRTHGIAVADYEEMLAAQGGCCAICGTDQPGGKNKKRFHLDHDHSCCPKGRSCEKCRRSLLCANCNVGLGALGDDPGRLMAAASYLISHGKGAAV